jgi:hypothetical protein
MTARYPVHSTYAGNPDGFLKQHEVENHAAEDFEHDLANMGPVGRGANEGQRRQGQLARILYIYMYGYIHGPLFRRA